MKTFNSIIVPLFILLPIVLGALKFNALPLSLKLIWYYLIITALINTSATIIGRVYHSNNLPLVHLYTIVEGFLLIRFYKEIFASKKHQKKFVFLQLFFVLLCIINSAFFQSIYVYSSYTRYTESIILMLFALNFFAKIAASDINAIRLPTFYFNTGIFLYFSGSFSLFIFSNIILTKLPASTMLYFWSMHSFLSMLMYLLFSIGFILCKK